MLLLPILLLTPLLVDSKGYSKQRRAAASVSAEYDREATVIPSRRAVFCGLPSFTERLPDRVREQVMTIWATYEEEVDKDCHMQVARTKNILQTLTPSERAFVIGNRKICKIPDIVHTLPEKAQLRIIEIWARRDRKGDCAQQQDSTRRIVASIPASLRAPSPPAAIATAHFKCDVPHFIDRLEHKLQDQLRMIWYGYKEGQSCYERIEKQLDLLSRHDISVESFQMPPFKLFEREQRKKRKMRRKASRA